MSRTATDSPRNRFAGWVVFAGALAIPLIYVPTLATRFDFIDDGNLVYPAAAMPLGERLGLVWEKIVANYDHLGPFRPVLWAHWELTAEIAHGDPGLWRLIRLGWAMFATAMLLALMRELRLPMWSSLAAAALAMWNPYRNEIWTSLTLSEAVAMPYALGALWCAARANRAGRAWPWDIASALAVLAALGCKNTFAAIVPAQMYLRMCADGSSVREGLRRHGFRAALLGLTLLLPIGHYIYFRMNWHPGQYPPSGVSVAQFGRMASALAGAMSLDFMGLGIALVLSSVAVSLFVIPSAATRRHSRAGGNLVFGLDSRLRGNDERITVWITALLLVAFGLVIYLPIPAVSGRYTMPAVWGLDLAFAGLLAVLCGVGAGMLRRIAVTGVVCGLIAVGAASVGKQVKFAARSDLLWQALAHLETTTDGPQRVLWVSGPALNGEEGIHFHWHLLARGQRRIAVDLIDDRGQAEERCELPAITGPATQALTGSPAPPPCGSWRLDRAFRADYWAGRKHFDCFLWSPAVTVTHAPNPR